jgi:hypothetical protein
MSKPQTLEQKITSALGNGSASSAVLIELINEVEAAAAAAAQTAQSERKAATLDLSRPVAEADEAVRLADLMAARLEAVLPRLKDKLTSALDAETRDRALADYHHVAVQRDAMVVRFNNEYPKHYAALFDLFAAVTACDAEVRKVNGVMSEAGEHGRLRPVELTARELDHFTNTWPSILETTRLIDINDGTQTWPPPTPNVAAIYAASMVPAPHAGADWHRDLPQQREQQQRQQDDVATFNKQREAGREQRANQEPQR